jgi:hypothetical protein
MIEVEMIGVKFPGAEIPGAVIPALGTPKAGDSIIKLKTIQLAADRIFFSLHFATSLI